jgi:hypothetical protein
MKLKTLMAGAAMAVAAGMAAAAHAMTYSWTFSDSTYSGSGTLVTDPTNTYAISGSGTITGPSLNELLTLVPNPTPGSVSQSAGVGEWNYDDAIPVDNNGLLFAGVTNPFYNLYANEGGGSLGISYTGGDVYNKDNSIIGTLTVVPVGGVIPEPATWAVMMLGFGGMGAMLRSRRKLAVAKI